MSKHEFFAELEDIHYKYERLTSLIGIMQIFAAEVVEIAGAPTDSLANALFEIESGMLENNERFINVIRRKGGAV